MKAHSLWPAEVVLTPDAREAYWLDVLAEQTRKAVEAWLAGQNTDGHFLILEKHLAELDKARTWLR